MGPGAVRGGTPAVAAQRAVGSTVESGLFAGATVVRTKILLNTDLIARLTPGGLTSVGGPVSLTVTG